MIRSATSLRALWAAPLAKFALAGIIPLILAAILAPPLLGQQADVTNLSIPFLGIGQRGHILGTDALGRDVLARTLVAARTSLLLALLASAVACIGGSLIGIAVSMGGRTVRGIGGRVIDATLGFPDILLAVLIVTILGIGSIQASLAVGLAVAPFFARLAFTLASAVVNMDYMIAAKTVGVSGWRRLYRYLAPNIAEPLLIAGFLAVSYTVIAISSLSFLGLGVQAPTYDWGSLLTTGLSSIYVTPAAALAPAIAIALAGMTFGLVGEVAARAANPTQRGTQRRRFGARKRAIISGLARMSAAPNEVDPTMMESVLSVRDLSVSFPSAGGDFSPVASVSLDVRRGEIVGIVGESGSGKSLTALAIGDLVPNPGMVRASRLRVSGVEFTEIEKKRRPGLYRTRLSYVFQDPNGSLNPALRVGTQLVEAIGGKPTHRQAIAASIDALREVDISAPGARMRQYPHQLSGGIKQRAAIAMSLLSRSDLLIADEPTTALDVTVQAQVLSVIRSLNERDGLSVLMISHSLGVVSELCGRVIVMYAGRVVEDGPVGQILEAPLHPYTRALLASMPRLGAERSRPLAVIPGRVANAREQVTGCPFAPRCPSRFDRCSELPPTFEVAESRVACWLHDTAP
jgi:oligopeptide/dipeptide ABC transporter ATP-binding protein